MIICLSYRSAESNHDFVEEIRNFKETGILLESSSFLFNRYVTENYESESTLRLDQNWFYDVADGVLPENSAVNQG